MMPGEDRNAKTLAGFLVQYRYVFTMMAMAIFALMLKLYADDNMKMAYVTLVIAVGLLIFKSNLIRQNGKSIVKQIEQWLFEFGVILIFSGFSSASLNPVFGASALVFGVLFMLIFFLLAIRKVIN